MRPHVKVSNPRYEGVLAISGAPFSSALDTGPLPALDWVFLRECAGVWVRMRVCVSAPRVQLYCPLAANKYRLPLPRRARCTADALKCGRCWEVIARESAQSALNCSINMRVAIPQIHRKAISSCAFVFIGLRVSREWTGWVCCWRQVWYSCTIINLISCLWIVVQNYTTGFRKRLNKSRFF